MATVVIFVVVTNHWIERVERSRTDGNGVPLERYDGAFGEVGSRTFIELTYVDGWVFFHSINPIEGQTCGVARSVPGGLIVVVDAADYLPSFSSAPTGRKISLSGDGAFLDAYGSRFPRRPAYHSSLDAMWNLDGKSSTLRPCKPTTWIGARLLSLALRGVN